MIRYLKTPIQRETVIAAVGQYSKNYVIALRHSFVSEIQFKRSGSLISQQSKSRSSVFYFSGKRIFHWKTLIGFWSRDLLLDSEDNCSVILTFDIISQPLESYTSSLFQAGSHEFPEFFFLLPLFARDLKEEKTGWRNRENLFPLLSFHC